VPNEHGLHRLIYLPHWRYPVRLPGLAGVHLNATVRVLAFGLIGIFIPIFVYQLTGSIEKVILFFLIWKVAQLLVQAPVGYLICRIGPDNSIALAAVLHIGFLVSLIFSINNPLFLSIAPIFAGIASPFHWIPYHTAFSKESDGKKLSEQVSTNTILQRVAAALAPLVGGILAAELGFSFLYFAAVTFLVVSIFPIFLDQYNKKSQWIGGVNIYKNIFRADFRPFLIAFLGTGLEGVAYAVFWPLYMMEKLGNLEKIGFVSTAALLVSLTVLHWTGKKAKKYGNRLTKVGGLISGANWLWRSLISGLSAITFTDILYQLTTIFVWIPTGAVMYQRGKTHSGAFFLQREITIHFGFLVGLLISWLILSANLGWMPIFFLGGIGIFMASCLRKTDGQVK